MRCMTIQPLQCDFGGYDGLDGYYQIEEYKIIPCEKVITSEEKPFQTLILTFPFDGLPSNDTNAYFKNKTIMDEKAKKFAAWLVVATGVPMRLFYIGFGGFSSGKSHYVPSQDFQEEKSPIFISFIHCLPNFLMVPIHYFASIFFHCLWGFD